MNKEDLFKGLWPALITPVGNNERPELKELSKLCEVLVKQGVDGLYVLGSTGQGVLFGEEDRKEVLEVVLDCVGGRIPVMAQLGCLTTRESVRLAEHAALSGAAAVSSVGPIYFAGGQQMAIHHYTEIAKAAQLPFFPYQLGVIPGDFGEFIQSILKIPFIEGMKLTTGNLLEISRVHNIAKDQLKLFSGADELFCQASLSGTVGAIGTFYNLWGHECRYVLHEFQQGNFQLARRFMLKFQEIIELVLPNIWTFLKEAMLIKHQVNIGNTISPLGRGQLGWTESQVSAILASLDQTLQD
ncbi:N-acetylneuraminate lyase [Pedobacter sp. CAN_A7]|uniref:dihydrodipicolinate synthase family protein n=1 Tax=Pedobacter sp. CAN_A7 TaxID=2787722 RepID=UPI0018CBAB68